MHRFPARALSVAVVALMLVLVAACGGSSAGSAGSAIQKPSSATAVSMMGSLAVIDVRTPAEYAAGHIAGAQNIDVEAADFGTKIAALDKKAPYLVYCHSGRRSGIASTQMAAAGFTDIVDGGAMADLVAAGAKTQP
jgi:rhodanese-related sulfurtransferase